MDRFVSSFTALCTVGFFAKLDYLYAFWIMRGILIISLPVFIFGVGKTDYHRPA
ncbi:MAG: hypothetical protein AAB089_08070 [Nitrospirota bacterium]